MNKSITKLFSILLILFSISGCASNSYNLSALAGTNIRDLEAAKSSGRSIIYPADYNETFNAVTRVLQDNKLTIYESNPKNGFIIVMGLPKQETTTRIGIFFESAKGSTKIILSSLSSTALAKADSIIFNGLQNIK